MFFYLSKIFWFLIQPLNFAIFLLVAGCWPRWLRSTQACRPSPSSSRF